MDRKKILEAMDYIDPALVEEAADMTPSRRTGWRKSALLAACLCLVLAGTAAAAARVFSDKLWITNSFADKQLYLEYGDETAYSGYEIVGGMTYIPAESLSEEVNRLAHEHPMETSYLATARWSAAEELIGWNLLDNPVLDVRANGHIYMDMGGSARGFCLISAGASDEGLTAVTVTTSYVFFSAPEKGEREKMEIELRATLHTDLFAKLKEGQDDISWERILFPTGEEITQEEYVTPSGLETVIFRIQPAVYSACFTLNGARFTLETTDTDNDVFALETLKAVLDACAV